MCLARANARAAQQEERGVANTRNKESKAEDENDIEDIEEVPAHDNNVSASEDDLTDVGVETNSLPHREATTYYEGNKDREEDILT